MVVSEIFRSIQGESTYAGLPCIFVRLTGCNLRCVWCDTAYAFYGGERQSVEEILERVRVLAHPSKQCAPRSPASDSASAAPEIPLVELTGGEPLLQPDVAVLAERLLAAGYTVLAETSGERAIDLLPREVVKIMDVKCPDSGEFGTFRAKNLDALGPKDEVKFVVASRRDYEFARDFTREHELNRRVRQVLFSPVHADPAGAWPGLDARELADWILTDALPVRLGLQLHKFIWHPATRGV